MPESSEVERWRDLYRAVAWMLNDYIGVNGLSVDFTQKHEALGYAHEGYHNARRVMRAHKPPVPEGMQHGIRCKCWAKERGLNAGTPHKHYDEPPYGCARCECKAYDSAVPALAKSEPDCVHEFKIIAWKHHERIGVHCSKCGLLKLDD